MQIYVKDEVGVTDLQVLTVQVTDVNEPPEFQGTLAEGKTCRAVQSSTDGGIGEDPGTEKNRGASAHAAVSLGNTAA